MRLLAQLTQQVAVVQYPSLSQTTVRHVELVPLGPRRVVLVLITDTGRVDQRVVDSPVGLPEPLVTELRGRLNAAVVGRRRIVPNLVRRRRPVYPTRAAPYDKLSGTRPARPRCIHAC